MPFVCNSPLPEIRLIGTTSPAIDEGKAFGTYTAKLYVPKGRRAAYKAVADWKSLFLDYFIVFRRTSV